MLNSFRDSLNASTNLESYIMATKLSSLAESIHLYLLVWLANLFRTYKGMNIFLFNFCIFFLFITPCFAGPQISHTDILGVWESKDPERTVQFYIDNTFLIKTKTNQYHRGNWVLYSGKTPLFFIMVNNMRVPCFFLSLRDNRLTITGHEVLAGIWEKASNTIKMDW